MSGGVAIGQHLPSCESTQDIARAWAHGDGDGDGDGGSGAGRVLVVLADHQTGGRGRQGRRWTDAAGAAMLASVAVRGPLAVDELEDLSVRAAHAVARVVNAMSGGELAIKHPNDLVRDGRKVGGVLVDSQVVGDRVEWVVVGIGVNLLGAPFAVDGTAASTVETEFGARLDARGVAEAVTAAVAALVGVATERVAWSG